ncbi:MAG: nucleotidyltransferase domain-containing protein [Thermoplasmata archaeon]|nr:nucleotidyltransferase domain-containing protein [Thermoplasmata archaeon]
MKFQNYVENLIASPAKTSVLRILLRYPDRRFTGRELASFADLSHPGALKALKALEAFNLVTISSHGRAYVISLNKESPLIEDLQPLFEGESGARSELVRRIGKAFEGTSASVFLFGSVARGEEETSSDIDVLVVTSKKREVMDIIGRLQLVISKAYGNPLSALVLSPSELKRSENSGLIEETKKSHIHVRGRSLEELL